MLLAWGIALVLGAAQGGTNPLRPLTLGSSSTTTTETALPFETVSTLGELQTQLAQAAQSDQPVFVHFTADWCISCKLMERDVYPNPQVAAQLNDFQRVAVDVTNTNANSRELLNHFDLFGPPSLLFFHQGEEVRDARIQGEVTAQALTQHLDSLKRWQQG